MLRRLLIAIAALVVLIAVAGAAAWFAAPSLLRPRLEAALTRAAGRMVTVGDVRPGWSSGPELRLSRLAVANAAWGSRPEMLAVEGVTVQVDAAALLRGAVRIPAIRVIAPDLWLETNASGQGNWERPVVPTTAPSEASPPEAAATGRAIELGAIAIENGRVAFRDGGNGRNYAATLEGAAEAGSDPAPFSATVHADIGEARIEGVLDRTAPLQRSSLSVAGTVLAPEPIEVAVKLTPGQGGQAVTAHAKGAGVEVSASGMLDPATRQPIGPVTVDATLAAGSPWPGRLGATAVGAPASLHALLRRQGETVTLRDLRLIAPPGDINGELDVAIGKPLSLRGSLSSQRLDLEKLLAPAPAPAPAASPPTAAPAVAPPAPPPPPGLPFALLDRVNADLRLAVAELHDARVTIRDLAGRLVIQDGKLALDPFAGTGPGGRLTVSVHADSRAKPPAVAVVLHAPALALQPFVALIGLPGDVSGTAAIEANLRAAGATQPDLLRSLGGRASVTMADGDIDLHMLGEILAAAKLPIDPRGRAHLRCLVMRAEIAGGVALVSPLVIDATTVLVQGTGNVDLVQRTLALRLRPLLRTGPGIVVPMTLTGPWAKPKVDVDRGDLAGVLTGLTAQAGDPCRAAGIATTAPPPATKPLKPADLLRSLLR